MFGHRTFKEVPKVELDRKGGTLIRTGILVRGETRDEQLLFLLLIITGERPSKIQEEVSPETNPAGTLVLDFQPPEQ